jgi:hypothetical protein
MLEPTPAQLVTLYYACHFLTNQAFQPIHIVRMDERTKNLFLLAGNGESIEVEILPNGRLTR